MAERELKVWRNCLNEADNAGDLKEKSRVANKIGILLEKLGKRLIFSLFFDSYSDFYYLVWFDCV